jgi:hypothetical protein
MLNVALIVEYSRIFDEENSVEELVLGIPRRLILQAATTFLNQEQDKTWNEVLSYWFRSSNQKFIDLLVRRFTSEYINNGVNPMIINPTSNLKLLQVGLEIQDILVREKPPEEIEIDLFKIYLLINESWTKLQIGNETYGEENYPGKGIMILLITMGFPASDLTNYIFRKEYYSQATKCFILFDFINNNLQLREHFNKFLSEYKITTLKEYAGKVFPFIKSIATKKKDGYLQLHPRKDANYAEDKFILEKLSVQHYSKSDDVDFKVVRSAPLIKTEEDSYRISHPLFFTDKLFKGLYFELSSINETIDKKIQSFRSYYTSNFSEKYLFYSIIQYFLNQNSIHFSGQELDELKVIAAPDYYIRNGKYIFLFENKDVLINAKIKESPSFPDLDKELKKKFLVKGETPVGVGQLVRNVIKTLHKQNPFDDNYNSSNSIIYPILVVHDIMFDCPGLNSLLNHWFFEELKSAKGVNISNVRPLVVMNIDTLICAAELLKERKVNLNDLLESYLEKTVVSQRVFRNEEELKRVITSKYLPCTKIVENFLSKEYPNFYKENKIMDFFYKKAFQNVL